MKNPIKEIKGFALYPLKFHLKMKLTLCLFTILFYQAQGSANSPDIKITLQLQNVSVEKVLKEIESKTEFKIMYNDDQVDYNRHVTVNFIDAPVTKVMTDLFKGTRVEFEIVGTQIVLTRSGSEIQKGLFVSKSVMVQQEISGKVIDTNGAPIPGVSV